MDSISDRTRRWDAATSSQASDTKFHSSSLVLGGRTGHVSCIVLFTSLHIFSMGIISGARGDQSRVRRRPAATAIFEPQRNYEWRSALLEMDYTIAVRYSYGGHQYVLQNVFMLKAVQVTFYKMEHSRPFKGDPAPILSILGDEPTQFVSGEYCYCTLMAPLRQLPESCGYLPPFLNFPPWQHS
jgi:hypothetical protein